MPSADFGYLLKLPQFECYEPKSLTGVYELLEKYGRKARILAGGTDLLVSMKKREISPQHLINIKTVQGMTGIRFNAKMGLSIKPLTTISAIASSPVILEKYPVIASAAKQLGNSHIRNMATIGGNLCNASPAADMAPPLLALGARVKLSSPTGNRAISLEKFFTAPGRSVLRREEILVEIVVPEQFANAAGVYLKLPARTALDIAAVGVACVILRGEKPGFILDARIVLGAVAPTPTRAYKAEAVLKGKIAHESLIETAARYAADAAEPICDIRCSDEYRLQMVKVLVRQALRQITGLST